ncbi:MAG: Gfo/Idh/MocA family oxidoreductase [Planctomycetes bacterium]|nr:Gfo/Idh/MocA family oxidoreductase [Planctomycetota bacterium]
MAKKAVRKEKKIRVGVIGVGRGNAFIASTNSNNGMELVAICDQWKEALDRTVKENKGITGYSDYDKFLEHDMDAVILANYFHEHTPFAIKALEAGKHVMTECSTNSTMAEGVALCRAVEKSGKIFMLAENYPYTKFNLEMKRLYKNGEIGDVRYAEGEYNHPMSVEDRNAISPGQFHWRNWLPSTYYCTHALAPLMHMTNTMPVSVNGVAMTEDTHENESANVSDAGSVILCRMDNGAIFRLFGLGMPGHSCWWRLHGECGLMESVRGPGYFGTEHVRVVHDPWDLKKGQVTEKTYLPEWPKFGKEAEAAGHGGGDFWTNYEFSQAIRTGKQPFLNVYRGVAMSSVGIQAWRSALEEGNNYALPNFKKEKERKLYEDDHWSPFPQDGKATEVPPSIEGFKKPRGLAAARKSWKKNGYKGK